MLKDFDIYSKPLSSMPEGRLLINTINAHSYNVSREDAEFKEALLASDVLIPDGAGIVWALRWLAPKPPKGELKERNLKRIAGWDLYVWEMRKLEQRAKNQEQRQENKSADKANVLFLGSTETVLAKIKARAGVDYPNVEVHTYSPPYKAEFSAEDNAAMIAAINAVKPDVLFVGMTAPKQEKWAYKMVNGKLLMVNDCHVCCIGAVFDFYAETVKRAPLWWQEHSLEWLYRLIKEPRRMWRRYLVGNVKFMWYIVLEKLSLK